MSGWDGVSLRLADRLAANDTGSTDRHPGARIRWSLNTRGRSSSCRVASFRPGPPTRRCWAELGDAVDARAKELEMYAGETVPPPGYSLETEVEGIRPGRRRRRLRHVPPRRILGRRSVVAGVRQRSSRTSSESRPHGAWWAGRTGQTPEEAAVFHRFRAIPKLPPDEIMPAEQFERENLAAGLSSTWILEALIKSIRIPRDELRTADPEAGPPSTRAPRRTQ
jgi:hypothetical protein